MSIQLDSALSGAHTQDHAEANVLALLRGLFAVEELNDLEQLAKMKLLLAGHNVVQLVEVVLLRLP